MFYFFLDYVWYIDSCFSILALSFQNDFGTNSSYDEQCFTWILFLHLSILLPRQYAKQTTSSLNFKIPSSVSLKLGIDSIKSIHC